MASRTGNCTPLEGIATQMKVDRFSKLLQIAFENYQLAKLERDALLLMMHIAQGQIPIVHIARLMKKLMQSDFLAYVAPNLKSSSKKYRRRALIITFSLLGIHVQTIADFVRFTPHAIKRFMRRYRAKKFIDLFGDSSKPRRFEDEAVKNRLFAIMHAPPGDYDINRTTWTITLLRDVLRAEGVRISEDNISKMIRAEGYVFRKTREVLTSNDPHYKEKLEKITRILRHLGPADRFFSIDEYGPFSIRERGGRRRALKNEKPTIPQYQQSKGFLIITAALELSNNKITHFYSLKKDTEEMIKLLNVLISEYAGCRRLYLSWDAASWHSSRRFLAEVRRVNARDFRNDNQSPMVKLTPLPARAQFLNVIESVFSGLAQSVLHHSNYKSLEDAKTAIDRYFRERNAHFQKNPRKAGNKIWGKEQVPSRFSVSHNCKDPRLMSLASIR